MTYGRDTGQISYPVSFLQIAAATANTATIAIRSCALVVVNCIIGLTDLLLRFGVNYSTLRFASVPATNIIGQAKQ